MKMKQSCIMNIELSAPNCESQENLTMHENILMKVHTTINLMQSEVKQFLRKLY